MQTNGFFIAPGFLQTSPFLAVRQAQRDGRQVSVLNLITGVREQLAPTEAAWLECLAASTPATAIAAADLHVVTSLVERLLVLDAVSMDKVRRLTLRVVDLEVAGTCNSECVFCPREALRQGRGVGIMKETTFYSTIDKLVPYLDGVVFAGIGEPTLNRHLPDFIRYLKGQGKFAHLVTNGSMLTEKLVGRLLDAGVDRIKVSFTGSTQASYEEHMVGLDFAKVSGNVERLLKMSDGKVPVTIAAVRTARNGDDLAGFVEHWRVRGAEAVVRDCHSRGGNISDPSVRAAAAVAPMLLAPASEMRCGLFNVCSFVTWQGVVLACSHDVHGTTRVGDLTTDAAETIIDRKLAVIAARAWYPICATCDESGKNVEVPAALIRDPLPRRAA